MNDETKQKGIDYIINLLSTLPTGIQITIIVLLVPLFYIGYRCIKDKEFRKDLFKAFKFRRRLVYKTRNHDVFLTKSIHNQHINSIRFNDDIKNSVFKIILNNKVNTALDKLREFADQELDDIEDIDIKMIDVIDDIVQSYEQKIKTELIKQYKEDGEFLYKRVYDDNFKIYHSINITYILKAVKMFSSSRLSINHKVYIFFNFINIALNQAVLDCEKLFDELNGELNKYNDKWHNG